MLHLQKSHCGYQSKKSSALIAAFTFAFQLSLLLSGPQWLASLRGLWDHMRLPPPAVSATTSEPSTRSPHTPHHPPHHPIPTWNRPSLSMSNVSIQKYGLEYTKRSKVTRPSKMEVPFIYKNPCGNIWTALLYKSIRYASPLASFGQSWPSLVSLILILDSWSALVRSDLGEYGSMEHSNLNVAGNRDGWIAISDKSTCRW